MGKSNFISLMMSAAGGDTPAEGADFNVISGATYELDDQPISLHGIYEHQIQIYNGYAYIATQKNDDSSDGNPMVVKVNVNDMEDYIIREISDSTSPINFHNTATLTIDDSGFIYILYPNHGFNTRLYKSIASENINNWTNEGFINTGGFSNMAYPSCQRLPNGNFIYTARETLTKILLSISVGGMDNFSIFRHLTEDATLEAPGADNPRFYPFYPQNNTFGGRLCLCWMKRVGSGAVPTYVKLYRTFTTDGDTVTNNSESFSKTISVSGELTEAEMDNNSLVYQLLSFTELNSFILGDMEPVNGYLRVLRNFGTERYYIYETSPDVFAEKRVDTVIGSGVQVAEWVFRTNGDIDLYLRDTNNGHRIDHYLTTDNFDSIVFQSTVINEADGTRDLKKAMNHYSVSGNKILAGSSFIDQAFNPEGNPLQNDLQKLKIT